VSQSIKTALIVTLFVFVLGLTVLWSVTNPFSLITLMLVGAVLAAFKLAAAVAFK
jgi:hypothetical protein